MNDIIESIEIGENYQIIGEAFWVTIKPINSTYLRYITYYKVTKFVNLYSITFSKKVKLNMVL